MASVLKQRLSRILKDGPTALLLPLGFRKEGLVYRMTHEEVAWIVDVQTSRWNDAHEVHFTINGGVYAPGVVSSYLRKADPTTPKLADCCISVRIGMLDQCKLDKWWIISTSDRVPDEVDARISAEMCNQVEELLLPFLARFTSLLEVAEFLGEPVVERTRFVAPQAAEQRYAYAGLLYSQLGERVRARAAIDRAMGEAKGKPNEEFIVAVGKHVQKQGSETEVSPKNGSGSITDA